MLGLRQSLTPLGRHLQEFLKMEDASDHHFVLIKIFPEFLVSFTGKRIFFLLCSVLLKYQGFEKRQWFLFFAFSICSTVDQVDIFVANPELVAVCVW